MSVHAPVNAPRTPDTSNLVPLRAASAAPTSGPPHLLTPPKQAAFCKALAHHGNVRLACRATQVSSQTVYRARRASPAFRQCWDAAMVIARDHAEQVLADRALNGVEEVVFYHGEEVAKRTRYDSRLLLAHLARLDKAAEAMDRCARCDAPLLDEHQFDAAVEALEQGAQAGAQGFAPGLCSRCSTLSACPPDREDAGAAASACHGAADGGHGGDPCLADEEEEDVPPLERRYRAMEAALPPHAQVDTGLDDVEWLRAEEYRLAAYEHGEEDWWLATGPGDQGCG